MEPDEPAAIRWQLEAAPPKVPFRKGSSNIGAYEPNGGRLGGSPWPRRVIPLWSRNRPHRGYFRPAHAKTFADVISALLPIVARE
jgi:hypothetical protein